MENGAIGKPLLSPHTTDQLSASGCAHTAAHREREQVSEVEEESHTPHQAGSVA